MGDTCFFPRIVGPDSGARIPGEWAGRPGGRMLEVEGSDRLG